VIDCIFTIDYEVYGNGTGALKDLVYEPAERLADLFKRHNARFVNFVEAAEFEKMAARCTDPYIAQVTAQIRDFHREGFEVGLHIHPQWYNARYENDQWVLDYSEYNLCTLPRPRIAKMVRESLDYLRRVVGDPSFTPLSFRAGNWLFQPTQTASEVLAEAGIKIDSSVYKGGLQRRHKLDYRPARRNGYYWRFESDVNVANAAGRWLEVPIHSEMVPSWQMLTSKRLSFSGNVGMSGKSSGSKVQRALDFMRFKYPLKLDFCRMTLKELTSMMDRVIKQDRRDSAVYKPIVLIGHTKDLTDLPTVDSFLSFLKENGVRVATFGDVYPKLVSLRSPVELKCNAVA
jgi:peptidoglycan/xylan/chitin deacetylase (PgdA/CDA1 family)